jgi:hypothetical protein
VAEHKACASRTGNLTCGPAQGLCKQDIGNLLCGPAQGLCKHDMGNLMCGPALGMCKQDMGNLICGPALGLCKQDMGNLICGPAQVLCKQDMGILICGPAQGLCKHDTEVSPEIGGGNVQLYLTADSSRKVIQKGCAVCRFCWYKVICVYHVQLGGHLTGSIFAIVKFVAYILGLNRFSSAGRQNGRYDRSQAFDVSAKSAELNIMHDVLHVSFLYAPRAWPHVLTCMGQRTRAKGIIERLSVRLRSLLPEETVNVIFLSVWNCKRHRSVIGGALIRMVQTTMCKIKSRSLHPARASIVVSFLQKPCTVYSPFCAKLLEQFVNAFRKRLQLTRHDTNTLKRHHQDLLTSGGNAFGYRMWRVVHAVLNLVLGS